MDRESDLIPESNETYEVISLEDFLEELRGENINPLSPDEVRDQLNETGQAILTRDFLCGIRANRESRRSKIAKVWTTNTLKNLEHPITKKFRFRKFFFNNLSY